MCNEASVRRNMEKSNKLFVQVRRPLPLGFCSGNKVVSEFYEMLNNLFRVFIMDSPPIVVTSEGFFFFFTTDSPSIDYLECKFLFSISIID
ncbi:hypothetical protein HanLR1_Chr06g0219501 [Helianthus annuus]|nr:hypothetical protein HanHA89_Chr06g0235581 [Helianthus annuus]KAJ0738543.1 hypothetical protein HanLR1_Chr06g0219501 [Helianthus annuus]